MRKGWMFIGVLALAMTLAAGKPATVRARQHSEESGKVIMGEVVVTASRQEEEVSRVPAHVTVISAEAIERSTAQNVPEALAGEGIHVTDITGNKRSYSVDLRGFGENSQANLLVLVDGRRINKADQSYADWTLIPLERIERIEIIRGGRGGVLYGDNASAGTINIITKEPRKNAAAVDIQYGSYDTFKGASSASAAGDLWSMTLFGSYMSSDGYRDNSDTEAKDIGLNANFDPLSGLRFHFGSGYHKSKTGLPGALLQSELDAGVNRKATNSPNDFNRVEDYYVNAGMEIDILSNDTFRLDGSLRRRNSDFVFDTIFGVFESTSELDTFTLSPQLVFREDFGTVKNRITIGYDYVLSKADYSGPFNLERANNSYYIFDDLQATEKLSLSGGYRKDKARYKFEPSDPATAKLDESAYTVGINYAYYKSSHIYANFVRSYRYPLLDEIYDFFENSIDTNLTTQTSNQYEIGIRHWLTDFLGFSANFFQIKTKNEIFYNPLAGFFGMNENLDGSTIRRGTELGATFNHTNFHAKASYTYTYAKIDGGQYDGGRVPNVPEHLASLHLGYQFDFGTSIYLSGIYVGKRPFISDFGNDFENQDDYAVVNARVQHHWRQFTFFVDLNNILNKTYSAYGVYSNEEAAYYPSPKFNLLAGVRAHFGGR